MKIISAIILFIMFVSCIKIDELDKIDKTIKSIKRSLIVILYLDGKSAIEISYETKTPLNKIKSILKEEKCVPAVMIATSSDDSYKEVKFNALIVCENTIPLLENKFPDQKFECYEDNINNL